MYKLDTATQLLCQLCSSLERDDRGTYEYYVRGQPELLAWWRVNKREYTKLEIEEKSAKFSRLEERVSELEEELNGARNELNEARADLQVAQARSK